MRGTEGLAEVVVREFGGNLAYMDMILKVQGRGRTVKSQNEERTWVLGHSEGYG